MKILKFTIGKMQNMEHFQFMTEFYNLILKFNPTSLKIAKFFAVFAALFAREDVCFKLLQKSSYTELMSIADQKRDRLFSGLSDLVSSALKHFSEEVVAAAKRLKILFDTYGNLAKLGDNKETSGVKNLIQDLEGRFAADLELIGGTAWVAELKASNEAFEELVNARYDEATEKPEDRMKDIRVEIDEVYRDITMAIEAFGKLTDTPAEITRYKGFIDKLNVIIKDYKDRIAQRDGTNTAKKDKEEE